MEHSAKIFVAVHRGVVRSTIVRRLLAEAPKTSWLAPARSFICWTNTLSTAFLRLKCSDYVLIAAAQVNDIQANNQLHPLQVQRSRLFGSTQGIAATTSGALQALQGHL